MTATVKSEFVVFYTIGYKDEQQRYSAHKAIANMLRNDLLEALLIGTYKEVREVIDGVATKLDYYNYVH